MVRLAPGLWGVLATPYAGDDLHVDSASLGRLARHYEQVGATGLTVLGVFGEAARLSTVERGAVLSSVAGAVGLPLVVGATSLSTSPLVEAEMLAAVSEVLQRLGFTDFTIQLNHRVLLAALLNAAGIEPEQHGTALVAIDKLDKIGPDGVVAELRERGATTAAVAAFAAFLGRPRTREHQPFGEAQIRGELPDGAPH